MNVAPRELWPAGAAVTATCLNAAAVVLGCVAWYQASGQTAPSQQVLWANLTALALCAAGTGNAIWLLFGRRAVGLRARSVISAAPLSHALPFPAEDLDALVSVDRGSRLHRPTCPLVRGKSPHPAAGPSRDLLRLCELCKP